MFRRKQIHEFTLTYFYYPKFIQKQASTNLDIDKLIYVNDAHSVLLSCCHVIRHYCKQVRKNEEIVNMGVDYYDILKLTRSATDADIKKK